MPELPTTKAKQRVHVATMIQLTDEVIFSIRLMGHEEPPHLRLVRQAAIDLYSQLWNRKGPRGRPVSDPITPAKIKEVFDARMEHPNWSQQEIAYHTNINIGRVSEILHGKRT